MRHSQSPGKDAGSRTALQEFFKADRVPGSFRFQGDRMLGQPRLAGQVIVSAEERGLCIGVRRAALHLEHWSASRG
jgi:hypothetical protein